ncbi:MAG: peptide ABC transporter permease [Ignavibacteriales bacterium CG_4_9_14_3_um_filter_34_10]|nr:MAG: peptide ABC transporter permease [Ignavibacteriales bacterium CG_4_9_14_3_um_filter_34_10]
MSISEIFNISITSLRTNKLRSSLTILGIVVGIFSIIAMSTVIEMLQASIESGVSALGKNTFQIQKWPAFQTHNPQEDAEVRNRRNLTMEEFFRLREKLDGKAKSVGAELWRFGKLVKFGNKETNPNVNLSGCTPEAFENNNWNVELGRAFNWNEVNSASNYIILGKDISNVLFKDRDPINEEVKIDSKKFRVIGVLESVGAFFGQSQDNFVLIPISTFQTYYGSDRRNSVNITVMTFSKDDYKSLMELSEGYFRTIRKVPPGKPNDFDFRTNEEVLKQINQITSGVKIGAYVVAAIALLAAGIGIMNIMLVSVTERTKEIGIRKSIGAKKKNILFQFLFESTTLCLFGGFWGIILGLIVGIFLGSLLSAKVIIPFDWVAIGVSLCVFIGVGFGTYPAYKASNLDPIEALRYE